jgi:flagellin-like protein
MDSNSIDKILRQKEVFFGLFLKSSYGTGPLIETMKRRGISPVLAELMLMAVAILLGIPMIGFTFGTMASFSNPAEVLASSSSCSPGMTSGTACSFTLLNLGPGSAVPTAILYVSQGNLSQESVARSCTEDPGNSIRGGSSYHLACGFDVAPEAPGDEYTGSIILSNGASVPFVGTFS